MQGDGTSCDSVPICFHGRNYEVSVSIETDALAITVEEESICSSWTASFSAKHVEELTSKAGSRKMLPVFARMLLSAIRQESESAFVDLLTPADLEALRARRHLQSTQAHVALPEHKRYLILTHKSEFDRVHYPLPLALEDSPDPGRLKRIISRLKKELAERPERASLSNQCGRSSAPAPEELTDLWRENAALRDRLVRVDRLSEPSATGQLGSDTALRELRKVKADCERLRHKGQAAEADGERRNAMLRREVRQKAQEASKAREETAAAKMKVLELQVRCQELEKECRKLKRSAKDSSSQRGWSPRSTRADSGLRADFGWRQESRSLGASPRGSRGRSSDSERPGRPTSSGRPPRFDPTNFVRRRQEREREAAAVRSSRFSPTAKSPRTSSLSDELSRKKLAAGRQSTDAREEMCRSASLDRLRAATASSRAKAGAPGGLPAAHTSSKPSHCSSRPPTPGRAAFGSTASSPRRRDRAQENLWIPPRASRAASPSQALRDVKARLNLFMSEQDGQSEDAKPRQRRRGKPSGGPQRAAGQVPDRVHRDSAEVSQSEGLSSSSDEDRWGKRRKGARGARHPPGFSSRGVVREGGKERSPARESILAADRGAGAAGKASRNISDIDGRLRELQDFLRAAKANAGIS